MKDVLKKVMETPDNKLSDDDHPNRPDLSMKEAIAGFKQIVAKHNTDPQINFKSNDLAKATVDGLNKLL